LKQLKIKNLELKIEMAQAIRSTFLISNF